MHSFHTSTKGPTISDDDKWSAAFSQQLGVEMKCSAGVCRGEPSDEVTRRWAAPGVADKNARGPCNALSGATDWRSSSAAISNPNCDWGGSSCTRSYLSVVL